MDVDQLSGDGEGGGTPLQDEPEYDYKLNEGPGGTQIDSDGMEVDRTEEDMEQDGTSQEMMSAESGPASPIGSPASPAQSGSGPGSPIGSPASPAQSGSGPGSPIGSPASPAQSGSGPGSPASGAGSPPGSPPGSDHQPQSPTQSGSAPGSPAGSAPGSPMSGAGSRPASPTQEGSAAGSPVYESGPNSPGSAADDTEKPPWSPLGRSRSPSPANSGSPPGSPTQSASAPGSPRSRSGSPTRSKSGSPARSRSGSPARSRSRSPARSRSGSPAGSVRSRSGSPARSRSGSPAGSARSQSMSPARSRSGSPAGSARSRSGSPARSRSGSPAGSVGSRASRSRSRSGSPAGSGRSRSGSPARSRSGSPASGRSRSRSASGSPARSRSRSASGSRSGRSRSGSRAGSRSRSRSGSAARSGSRSPARSRSGSPASRESRSRSGSRAGSDRSRSRSGSGDRSRSRSRSGSRSRSPSPGATPPYSPHGSPKSPGDARRKAGKLKGSDDESDKEALVADIFGSSDEEEEFEGFGEADVEATTKKKEKKTAAIVSDDDEDEGLATGQTQENEVLPELSDDDADKAAREDGKNDGDIVSDFDLMMSKKKEEMQRRRKKRKDFDLINDSDDLIADMIQKMKVAAEEDRGLNMSKKPAVCKLRYLPTVMSQLRKSDLQGAFLDCGILGAMTEWLAPLPDKSLPNLQIRESFLKLLQDFPSVSPSALKNSGIGKAIMYLYKHPKEIKENKERAGKLINDWSRPLFNLTSNYKMLSKEEREQRDYDQLPKRRRTSMEDGGMTPRKDLDKSLTGDQKALRPGDPGWVYRARVPMPSNKDYVIRPKWKTEEEGFESEMPMRKAPGKKEPNRYEKQVRRLAEKKKNSKTMRAVTISIEGRNMAL